MSTVWAKFILAVHRDSGCRKMAPVVRTEACKETCLASIAWSWNAKSPPADMAEGLKGFSRYTGLSGGEEDEVPLRVFLRLLKALPLQLPQAAPVGVRKDDRLTGHPDDAHNVPMS